MPTSKNPDWIDWFSSKARAILLEDLEPGGILDGQDHLKPAELFGYYKTMGEFKDVVIQQFTKRLVDHRKQASVSSGMADRDAEALKNDIKVYPRRPKNARGEPVFDMHAAKELLREDIKNDLHKTMKPSALQNLRPEAYGCFTKEIFKQRIYQEVRRKKFLHFLEIKRIEGRKAPPRSREQIEQFDVQFASRLFRKKNSNKDSKRKGDSVEHHMGTSRKKSRKGS
jgi:hypothetical protein